MSAGGLSYSGLTTSRKATLPSVEMWGTNMNILRDPPASIHTRRIDKVGDTQSILLAQDESGDRICEMINVYARGVNPMVSVSYDNFSNNAGGNPLQNRNNASLPYKVENVRPPVLRQEDLLPLSRLPRNWFHSYSNPSFPDIVQASQCNETGSTIHQDVLHANAQSNKGLRHTDLGDATQPRTAPQRTVLADLLPLQQTSAGVYQPGRATITHDGEHRDANAKNIQTDKLEVKAVANQGTTQLRTFRDSEFDTMDGRRVHEEVTPIQVRSGQYAHDKLVYHDSFFDSKDPKQIQQNKLLYELLSKKTKQGSGRHHDTKMSLNKFIQQDKFLCMAQTSRTREDFIHPHKESVNTLPVKDYLYKDVQSQPTSVFQRDRIHEQIGMDKAIDEAPLHVEVKGKASSASRTKTLPHESLSRDYTANPAQPTDVFALKTAQRETQSLTRMLEDSVHPSILHASAQSAKHHRGGHRPTDDSLSSFSMNPHLYKPVDTVRTGKDSSASTYLSDAVLHRTLHQRTTGHAVANKTFMGGDAIRSEDDHTIRSGLQTILPVRAEGRKTFIGNGATPYQDTTVTLADRRTPLQSVKTSTSGAYTRTPWMGEKPDQKRRVPLLQTETSHANPHHTLDLYDLQSRNAEKRVSVPLPVGGFSGGGSAVPQFDPHDPFQASQAESQHTMDPTRDRLRQRTQASFQERFPVLVG